MAEPTLQDMTLEQAFEIHTKGKSADLTSNFRKTLLDLEKAGYPSDTLISEINTEEAITNIQKFITTKRFKGVSTSSGMFGSRLKTLINVGKPLDVGNVVTAPLTILCWLLTMPHAKFLTKNTELSFLSRLSLDFVTQTFLICKSVEEKKPPLFMDHLIPKMVNYLD